MQTVTGCTIPFKNDTLPAQTGNVRISRFNKTQHQIVGKEIEKLVDKQVLELAKSEQGEYISPIFLVPKKNGTFRLILNLKEFNQNVQYCHFKMETLTAALNLIKQDCLMASVDLKDAYYGVPVYEEFRKFLRFIWNGQLYQFTCLPNGLSCAPRKYTKMMKPVYASLRRTGHSITGFLDDMLIVADSDSALADSVQRVLEMLQTLGFVINFEKSALQPTTKISYLGFEIESKSMEVTLPDEKKEKLVLQAKSLAEI